MNLGGTSGFWSFAFLTLTLGCVKQVPSAPKALPALENTWSFSLDLQVETQSDGLSDEAASWFQEHGMLSKGLSGLIKEGPFRINRDGTESWRLHFEALQDGKENPSPLEGYAVETRRFAGGPLLALQQTAQASGPGKMVDALDPLLALLFLVPPDLEETRHSQLAWPFRQDSGRKSHHFSTLAWTSHDSNEGLAMRYEGELSEKGQDRLWKTRSKGRGRLEGEVLLDEGGSILEHRFLVERDLVWELEESGSQIRQKHTLRGSFSPGVGRTVPPWGQPFYLTEKDVLQGLHGKASDFEACAPEPNWSVGLSFRIERDGSVSPQDELQSCSEVLSVGAFPPHHQSNLTVSTQVVLKNGVFLPFPRAEIPHVETPPAHLILKEGAEVSTAWTLLQPRK